MRWVCQASISAEKYPKELAEEDGWSWSGLGASASIRNSCCCVTLSDSGCRSKIQWAEETSRRAHRRAGQDGFESGQMRYRNLNAHESSSCSTQEATDPLGDLLYCCQFQSAVGFPSRAATPDRCVGPSEKTWISAKAFRPSNAH